MNVALFDFSQFVVYRFHFVSKQSHVIRFKAVKRVKKELPTVDQAKLPRVRLLLHKPSVHTQQ